jgi:hypothetical protein
MTTNGVKIAPRDRGQTHTADSILFMAVDSRPFVLHCIGLN